MNHLFIQTILSVLLLVSPSFGEGERSGVSRVYPVPPANDRSLFYIQRTKNTNAIVYEANMLPDGRIDTTDPVKIYWIRYSSDSTTAGLTSIQRTYAYGVNATELSQQKNSFVIKFNAYKKRNIFLMPAGNEKRYAAFTSINGKMAELKKIFISTSGGTFWFPKIEYVELSGRDPSGHQAVVERFVP
jgi:hypothetical protein